VIVCQRIACTKIPPKIKSTITTPSEIVHDYDSHDYDSHDYDSLSALWCSPKLSGTGAGRGGGLGDGHGLGLVVLAELEGSRGRERGV
jgi:hypothetical protein